MNEPALIRTAVLADAPEIARLMTALGYPTEPSAMRRRLEAIFFDRQYHTLVADARARLVGLVGLRLGLFYEKDSAYVQIAALVVDREQRRTGIGAQLVREAERWARSRGALDLVVNSNLKRADAHEFYESQGYERRSLSFRKTLDP